MKVYDISQGVFGCEVYEGDPVPERKILKSMDCGEVYNLTAFSMCAHNGTHIDAPSHFIKDGVTIDKIPPEKFIGDCFVAEFNGVMDENDAKEIFIKANTKKLLIKGDAEISLEAAKFFSENGIELIGVEPQSVGPYNAPMAVHIELLSKNVVILEGIRLNEVPCGKYFLSASPLLLQGSDGAPCRVFLVDFAQS